MPAVNLHKADTGRFPVQWTNTPPATGIIAGDCLEVMPALAAADLRFDLIVADPPYNFGVEYDEHHDKMPRAKFLDFTRCWLERACSLLTDRGSIFVVIDESTEADVQMYLRALGLSLRRHNIWHYRFGQNVASNFISSHAHVLYFAKDLGNHIWHGEHILEPSDRASRYGDPRTQNKKEGRNGLRVPFDVWQGEGYCRIQGNNKERRKGHCNQIPEAMLVRILRACTDPDSRVLDPFVGSGTTTTVARALGLESIGIELSAAYAKSAFERTVAGPARIPPPL